MLGGIALFADLYSWNTCLQDFSSDGIVVKSVFLVTEGLDSNPTHLLNVSSINHNCTYISLFSKL